MSDISVGTLLGEVPKLLRRRFDQLTREHEVTLPQWRVLGELHHRDGISQKALADAMDADAMTVSGILDRLEKRGLLLRTVDPADSRAKLVNLTAEGAALIAETRKLGGELIEQVLEGLDDKERQVLAHCLNHIRTRLIASLNDLNKDA